MKCFQAEVWWTYICNKRKNIKCCHLAITSAVLLDTSVVCNVVDSWSVLGKCIISLVSLLWRVVYCYGNQHVWFKCYGLLKSAIFYFAFCAKHYICSAIKVHHHHGRSRGNTAKSACLEEGGTTSSEIGHLIDNLIVWWRWSPFWCSSAVLLVD